MLARITLTTLFVLVSTFSFAKELLKSTTSWDGQALSYPKGEAELTSMRLTLKANQALPFHCHPVPTFGYILSGEMEVETAEGKTTRFKAGDAVIEVMKTVHRGRALDSPVEILVFYAGEKNTPNTVLPKDDPNHKYCS
ncbi:MAG: cupin domain-containing protein [Gammaproteobacteria bacterium]|nr:cupin domain-containing protein [Gammaproteobacteria bacterium]